VLQQVPLLFLVIIALYAFWLDYHTGRISNHLTYPAIAIGLLLHSGLGGWDGLSFSSLGMILGAGPFLVVYFIGLAINKPLIGGGDVKLMGAVGALAGPLGAMWSVYYGLWVGALTALGVLAWHKARHQTPPLTIPFGSCLTLGVGIALMLHSAAFFTH
jgi:prepilin peptidase CpaA